MTSDRKLNSNRTNATKSTGPRSKAGKLRSSRNAARHGLTGAISDPQACEEIENLVKVFAPSGDRNSLRLARTAAYAQYDLLRIRKARTALYADYASNVPSSHSLGELHEALRKLDRYDHRAAARRKRAFRALLERVT
jgi:hypothetical protein